MTKATWSKIGYALSKLRYTVKVMFMSLDMGITFCFSEVTYISP